MLILRIRPHDSTGRRAHDFVLLAMSAVAAADGKLEDREINTIQQIHRTRFGRPVSGEQIRTAAEFVSRNGGLFALLSAASDSLDEAIKGEIVQAAYLVLLGDGAIRDEERKALQQIAIALRVPEFHFGSILENLAIRMSQSKHRY